MRTTLPSLLLAAILAVPAHAESSQELSRRITRLADEQRKRDGFPPSSDPAGTLVTCDRKIKEAQTEMLRCVGERARRLAPLSAEAAPDLAVAVVAGCSTQRERLIRAAWPYCISERGTAEASAGRFTKTVEGDVLALIVEYRARPPARPSPPPAKPDTAL